MEIHRFNGIMMRVTNNGKAVYFTKGKDGYCAIHCQHCEGGITDNLLHTGNLNEFGNLEKLLGFIQEHLLNE